MTLELFPSTVAGDREALGSNAQVLRGFALPFADRLIPDIAQLERESPFRYMQTPGGFTMSVALTNCGRLGWTTDRLGYRYTHLDPVTERPWPAMPDVMSSLAHDAAAAAGFSDFSPDACLINRYEPGARMSLHQDKNERDFSQPIVSVSLGMTAIFQFGGFNRSDKATKTYLYHGDVVVWGGEDRLRFHGVLPVKDQQHPVMGRQRINITFRKAG
jgi:alkylated DNA repair protein (DNA oxidative demethylase)